MKLHENVKKIPQKRFEGDESWFRSSEKLPDWSQTQPRENQIWASPVSTNKLHKPKAIAEHSQWGSKSVIKNNQMCFQKKTHKNNSFHPPDGFRPWPCDIVKFWNMIIRSRLHWESTWRSGNSSPSIAAQERWGWRCWRMWNWASYFRQPQPWYLDAAVRIKLAYFQQFLRVLRMSF